MHESGLWVSLGAAGVVLGVVLGGAASLDVAVWKVTRDPAAIADHPWYYGLLSNLGVMLWAATAGALAIASAAIWRLRGWTTDARFLAYFAGLTMGLAIDDLYMVHEAAAPQLLAAIGIPASELVAIGIYGAVFAGGLVAFQRSIRRSGWLPLAAAMIFFAISLAADALTSEPHAVAYAIEDGAKLLGIVAWGHYFGATALRSLAGAGGS